MGGMLDSWQQLERWAGRHTSGIRGEAKLISARADSLQQAIRLSEELAVYRILRDFRELDLQGVVNDIVEVLRQCLIVMLATTGGGALIGGIAGGVGGAGVGAIPGVVVGAGAGAQVGEWILIAMGLKALAEYVVKDIPGIARDYWVGIRQAWLPLFDKYEVDLVLSGHEHDYERTYPVRGYDTGAHGTVAAPNPGQTKGAAVDTRRPSVAATEPHDFNGTPAWNTAEGTVYLVLGGGGTNGPTNTSGTDAADDKPQAKVITTRNAVVGSEAAGFVKNGADSIEDAPWSAAKGLQPLDVALVGTQGRGIGNRGLGELRNGPAHAKKNVSDHRVNSLKINRLIP